MKRSRQTGWLGIDIGTASVKVAQLARDANGLHVLAQSIVPRSTHHLEAEGEPIWSAVGEICTAVAVERGFRGRQAAVAMPMGFCDVHRLDHLAFETGDLDSVVRGAIETITQNSADDLEFDIWPAEIGPQSSDPQHWNVLAVARPWSDRVYRDVVESGYLCRTIDGVPHALARAMNLIATGEPLPPVAVLDWGFSQATLCIIADGRPVYVRSLKDCSFERTLSAIVAELGINHDEAQLLLEQHGVRGLSNKNTDEVAALVAELTAEPLRQLEQELSRTISHIGFQRRTIAPQKLYLFGGGALIKGLPRFLGRRLRLETHVWSLGPHEPDSVNHDCLFGSAMALSALAWEDQ